MKLWGVLGVVLSMETAGSVWADQLEENFKNPPLEARPHTYWHWVNGNVTKEGVTLDLESMARVGVGGADIYSVSGSIPPGPLTYQSPEWYDMMDHTAREAKRLGISLGMHNCPGWSTSGGPWITPEQAMQHITIGETNVSGPSQFKGLLKQPETTLGFYRDIAVLAFPSLATSPSMQSLAPAVSTATGSVDASLLFDGLRETQVMLPLPESAESFLQFEFSEPLTTRFIELVLEPAHWARNVTGVIQTSDDGVSFRDLKPFVFFVRDGSLNIDVSAHSVPVRFYRIRFNKSGFYGDLSPFKRIQVAEVSFSSALRISNVEERSGMSYSELPRPFEMGAAPEALMVGSNAVRDLSDRLDANGHLDWEVPAGDWTVLRIGYTPTGRQNREPPDGVAGLECDKLNPIGADAHWNGSLQPLLQKIAGYGSLDKIWIDSYEVGGQNWTPGFREEFQRRRGYDLLPWLVSLTGRVVNSPELTERFLWDMRRTVADLLAENFYGRFRKLCDQNGVKLVAEPYGGPFEAMQCGGPAHIPTGEFWMSSKGRPSIKLAASTAHIYGHPVVAAEAFTADPEEAKWQNSPETLKVPGDWAFCNGANRLVFHSFVQQPWSNYLPGITMGKWGVHLGRTATWWEQSRPWIDYLSRCQYLLQTGRFVADVAAFYGEGSPVIKPTNPNLPLGYDYDGINAEVLLNEATVENGELVLRSGMRYRILALCAPDQRIMSPQLLNRLNQFVSEGLTLVGPPPEHAPGLTDYPESDRQVEKLVAGMWGRDAGEHTLGKGRVVWGRPLAQVLSEMKILPDFECVGSSDTGLEYIHRVAGDTEIYFVANQLDHPESVDCVFRVSGKVPELWHPDTGTMEQAAVWSEKNGRITVPIQFDPKGSVFVIFRQKEYVDHAVKAEYSAVRSSMTNQLVISRAIYGPADGNLNRDVTEKVAGMVCDGALRVRASHKLLGGDPAPRILKRLLVEYVLDGVSGEKSVSENELLMLGAFPAGESSGMRLEGDLSGALRLCATTAGRAKLTMASGKILKAEVDQVPVPLVLLGPWELNFPAGRGAPLQVQLPELISWTEHSEVGVKYFSGTASYIKKVEIPVEMLGNEKQVWLDLGVVKNIAEVFVNDHEMGILWKPPFRVAITDAVRPGANRIEIRVTNLWPNRLIGDDQLPPDREWSDRICYGSGHALKVWPQWLREGRPSPTGRFTFTTWDHWTKDDTLLLSGLLGPVSIYAEVNIPIADIGHAGALTVR